MKQRQPLWHTPKNRYAHYATRRILDFEGHDLILNSKIPSRCKADLLDAFEVRSRDGDFLGVVWSCPTSREGERTRWTIDWHAVDHTYKFRLNKRNPPNRAKAIDWLIDREQKRLSASKWARIEQEALARELSSDAVALL